MSKKKLVEDMKQNPARFYRAPSDVVRDRRFGDAERLEILGAWEREARSRDEVEPESVLLQQVLDARMEIERKMLPESEAFLARKQ